jgi:hypothetical protein
MPGRHKWRTQHHLMSILWKPSQCSVTSNLNRVFSRTLQGFLKHKRKGPSTGKKNITETHRQHDSAHMKLSKMPAHMHAHVHTHTAQHPHKRQSHRPSWPSWQGWQCPVFPPLACSIQRRHFSGRELTTRGLTQCTGHKEQLLSNLEPETCMTNVTGVPVSSVGYWNILTSNLTESVSLWA